MPNTFQILATRQPLEQLLKQILEETLEAILETMTASSPYRSDEVCSKVTIELFRIRTAKQGRFEE